MALAPATKFSHKLFEPAPWTIAETNHCVVIFDKQKIQREQGRFCDVILKVHGRDFPAHRSATEGSGAPGLSYKSPPLKMVTGALFFCKQKSKEGNFKAKH